MSHYTKVKTKIVDRDFLVKALAQLGFTNVEVHDTPVNLVGYLGDTRSQKANVVIRKQYVGMSSNDIGFVQGKDGSFSMIVSEFDASQFDDAWLMKLTRTYAEAVVTDKLASQGFVVQKSETRKDGGRKLVLVRG
ncbi:MAG: DUF1257 domain-containing protein [Candidatus Obscuribacterales bacterium]|nr:DUF1257 domain-containing protein [Candidatus Obscuribacterales bacterium]